MANAPDAPHTHTHTFIMHVFTLLCVLGFLGASMAANPEYEENYADNYGNEISQDQQMGE